MMYLMNSAMMPQAGTYTCKQIDKESFFESIHNENFKSNIGYPQNAKLISERIGRHVPVSREYLKIQDGDILMVMKLMYRVDVNSKGINVSEDDFEYFMVEYSSVQT